jgi:hypothetical protein
MRNALLMQAYACISRKKLDYFGYDLDLRRAVFLNGK